jgi:hypothetical protein
MQEFCVQKVKNEKNCASLHQLPELRVLFAPLFKLPH